MSGISKRRNGAFARHRRDSRGAVVVEFAIIVPFLAMLLLGITTLGMAYSHAIGLTNAVREGARFAATRNPDPSWAAAAADRARQTQFDDQDHSTTFCAVLMKNSSGGPAVPLTVQQAAACFDASGGSVAVVGVPTNFPSVDANQCVAAVWGIRPYTVNFVLGSVSRDVTRYAQSLYQRTC